MITFGTPKHHWNYFIAIEKDLESLSRYIEFAKANLTTYSIELTHILLSASSEIDVIMKQLCELLAPNNKAENIKHYKDIVTSTISGFADEEIFIDRFGLSYKPWESWLKNTNPNWWTSHNNVKHQRNNFFHEANLQNTINAVGALLITVTHYYKYAFSKEANQIVRFNDTTRQLQPESTFLKMNANYYHYHLITE